VEGAKDTRTLGRGDVTQLEGVDRVKGGGCAVCTPTLSKLGQKFSQGPGTGPRVEAKAFSAVGALQTILGLCIPVKELAKTRSQI
jgi:hypothetical protein